MQAIRIARPTDDVDRISAFYRVALGLEELARFHHEGIEGAVLGRSDLPWHLEFVHPDGEHVGDAPNMEHLVAIYHRDHDECAETTRRVVEAGGRSVDHPNPWWNRHGSVHLDPDGYPLALIPTPWSRSP